MSYYGDGMITNKQALKAYNLLRDYCDEHDNCDGCLLCSAGAGCILPDSPSAWQDLEPDCG